jgi:hypothetical protein
LSGVSFPLAARNMQVPCEIERDRGVKAFVLPHMCWQNGTCAQAVIARSEATKQSSFLVAASWIASLRSQ